MVTGFKDKRRRDMRTLRIVLAGLAVALLSVPALISAEHPDRAERIHAALTGYQEVPSVSTPASGEFHARIARDHTSIDYELSYDNLVGTVQQSHIHFAQRGVNGS